MTRIYISGPMTGLPQLNFPAFNAEAERLRALGFQVVNPADLNADGTPWQQCMRIDLAAMLTCDTIAMLPRWQESRGATLEFVIATELDMPAHLAANIGSGPLTTKLNADRGLALRMRHWALTAAGLKAAQGSSAAEAVRAYEFVAGLGQAAGVPAEGGAA